MKRILLICLSVCLLGLPAQVQAAWRFSPKQITAAVRRGTAAKKVEPVRPAQPARPVRMQKPTLRAAQKNLRTLNTRVERSIQQASQTANASGHFPFIAGPIRSNPAGHGSFPAEYMYPEKLYLQHPQLGAELTEAYFIAQTNRLFAKHLKDLEVNFWPLFEEAKPLFCEEADAIEQPKNLWKWTTQQIPVTTKELFIGEIHDYYEIPYFIKDLLPLLVLKNPERKIILFTEFLQDLEGKEAPLEKKVIMTTNVTQKYSLWETAEQLGITLVGLESQKWPYDFDLEYVLSSEGNFKSSFPYPAGATAEGLRMRNDHWYKILQEYRQKNPDALFIVYTGSAHSYYNFPFSLAKRFPKETTFMLDLTMDLLRSDKGIIYGKDHLERLDEGFYFPQPVLKWNSPDLIQLSGFDARIKLPLEQKKEP